MLSIVHQFPTSAGPVVNEINGEKFQQEEKPWEAFFGLTSVSSIDAEPAEQRFGTKQI